MSRIHSKKQKIKLKKTKSSNSIEKFKIFKKNKKNCKIRQKKPKRKMKNFHTKTITAIHLINL